MYSVLCRLSNVNGRIYTNVIIYTVLFVSFLCVLASDLQLDKSDYRSVARMQGTLQCVWETKVQRDFRAIL
jgi:hypothetical protein